MKPDRSFRILRLRGRRLRAVPVALLAGLLAVIQLDIVLADRGPGGTGCSDENGDGRPDAGAGCTDDDSTPDEPSEPPRPVVVPRPRPTVGLSLQFTIGPRSSALAERLAREVALVKRRFDRNRRELPVVQSPGGGRAYPRQEVAGLIARTGKDLNQAIEKVGEPGLEALSAWSVEELRPIQEELAAPSGQTAALPHAVARLASLGGLPGVASVSAAAPQQETIPAETSNRLLDQVGEVIGRIFSLARKDDLEVELWVGSTPAPQATFRFWSQGQIKGSTPAPIIIRTNGKRDRILRGLYAYRATLANGPVAELIAYPSPAGADGLASERLDLVTGSSFFCCQFNEQYCRHVASEKECRP